MSTATSGYARRKSGSAGSITSGNATRGTDRRSSPAGSLAQIGQRLERVRDLRRSRPHARQQLLAGLSQAYAPRRALEQHQPGLRFERANRLTHRRRRDAELGGGSAKARVPRDREELRQTAETVTACHGSPGLH